MEQARFLSSPQQGVFVTISANLILLGMSLFATFLILSHVLDAFGRVLAFMMTLQDVITILVFIFVSLFPIIIYCLYFWSMIPGAFSITLLSEDEMKFRKYFHTEIIRREDVVFAGFERTDRWALRFGMPDNPPIYSDSGLPPRNYKFCIKTGFQGRRDKLQTIRIPLMFPSQAFASIESWFHPV